MAETEQVFFNTPLLVLEDIKHNRKELRFHADRSWSKQNIQEYTLIAR